jgi:hypothetical protein
MGNIKNITFAGPTGVIVPTSKVGMSLSDSGIHIKDNTTQKYIVPSSSFGYSRALVDTQTKLNSAVGASFMNGIEISNLNAANLGATGTSDAKFTITLVM